MIAAIVRIIEENEKINKCMYCNTLAYYQISNIVVCDKHISTAITDLLHY